MSELMIYKANELVISRYDLTEHETKLILFCTAKLNPTIEKPNEEQRTIIFSCSEYAHIMNLSYENAWGRLNSATSDLFKRSIELIYPTGAVAKRVFNWADYAEFNRDKQEVKLIFSKYIIPYLFQLKLFIKYNLEHVKSFENKYSMRVYEWLLKELTQRKTNKANIDISIIDFKFMLMLENNYPNFKFLNVRVLKPITNDINNYSNMTLAIEKKGRPANRLIFHVELNQKYDLVKKFSKLNNKKSPQVLLNAKENIKTSVDSETFNKIEKTLTISSMHKIKLSEFESKFLNNMKSKYELSGTFNWLSDKQKTTLINIITKYEL